MFYTIFQGRDVLFKIDSSALHNLAIQMASSLIAGCKENPTDGSPPTKGAATVVQERFNWGNEGFINPFQSQASFLHDLADAIVHNPKNFTFVFLDKRQPTIQLIAEALQSYQTWKERICDKARQERGENWGSATGFFNTNWADLNERLLALNQPPRVQSP